MTMSEIPPPTLSAWSPLGGGGHSSSSSKSLAEDIFTNVSLVAAAGTKDPCSARLSSDYYDVWRDVKFWCLALIIPVGLVFNFISFGVFVKSWMRHVVSGRYFMALALADNLVLIGELLLWLNASDSQGAKTGLTFHHDYDFFCKFTNILRYGARMWSSWLTVAITIERFLSVSFPFKIMSISNPTKAVAVVTCIGVTCFLLAFFFTFSTVEAGEFNERNLCMYTDRHTYTLWLVIVIAGIGEMVLPSIIVTFFTSLIIWRLALARQERLRMRQGDGQLAPSMTSRRTKASEIQPTIALLAIAIVFISIRMPYVIMFFINMYKSHMWPCLDKWLSYKIYAVYTVSMVMAVLNYAVNFCLYCLTGSAFRTEVRRCILHRASNHLYHNSRPRSGYQVATSRAGRDHNSCLSRSGGGCGGGRATGSSPPASCPAAPITTHTWGRKDATSDPGGAYYPDLSAGGEVSRSGGAASSSGGGVEENYMEYHVTNAPDSPPLWSERTQRQPAKTLKVVCANGSHQGRHLHNMCNKSNNHRLRVSLSEEYISTKQTNLVLTGVVGGAGSETEVVTYGSVDGEFKHRSGSGGIRLKPISRKELAANRKCLDYRPLSGMYDPKTETVFFVTDNSNGSKWGKRKHTRPLNCFFSSREDHQNAPEFC